MPEFRLDPLFTPAADQPKAIREISASVREANRYTTLLGATGTGKTMTMAATIAELQKPALVLAHNKTLAAQLCNEFRTFFPENAVEYFVSYYDYYQPEAYVPSKDLYIEKDSAINQEVDRLRHAATAALFARRDVIIVASVSAIFGLGSPETYDDNLQNLVKGETIDRDGLLRKLVSIQYSRNDVALGRGNFRVRGESLEIFPAYSDSTASPGDAVRRRDRAPAGVRPAHGRARGRRPRTHRDLARLALQRARGDGRGGGDRDRSRAQRAVQGARGGGQAARESPSASAHAIRHGDAQGDGLLQRDRELLADPRRPAARRTSVLPDRLLPRRLRLLPGRVAPDRPADRRHVRGDRSRKQTLVDYGFRLPSAMDNRPQKFDEFLQITPQIVFVSATPGKYERAHSKAIVEQIVRPTGIVDPPVDVRPTRNQIDDLMNECRGSSRRPSGCSSPP